MELTIYCLACKSSILFNNWPINVQWQAISFIVIQGSPPKNEVAGDKLVVGGSGALVHLGKAVTFLFMHLHCRIQPYERFYCIQ